MNVEIPCSSLFGMRQILEARGLNADILIREAGLPSEALENECLLAPAASINRFLELAIEATGDRFLLLELAKHQGWYILFPIMGPLSQSKTVRELLQTLSKSLELFTTALSCYLQPEKDGCWFGYEVRQHSLGKNINPLNAMQITELGMAIGILEIRQLLGRNWQPTYVRFMHASPENRKPLESVFGKNLHFNQDHNASYLTKQDLDCPIPDDWFEQCISKSIQQLSPRSEISFSIQVDRCIRLMIGDHCCTLEEVAENFNLPPRTLQHHLKQEKTSYQQLLDQVRLELARYYLSHSSLSVGAIAERLHFSETPVFSRFFKQKLHTTPRQYRANLKV